MKHMVIMRGGPGSGKSTIAQAIFRETGAEVLSADDYWYAGGAYEFRPSELGQAHGQCFRRAIFSVSHRSEDVVIDNTNARPDELIPFLALAQAFGYTVEIIKVLCDMDVAFARQIHGVPRAKFEQITRAVEQTKTPSLYRGAPWISEREVWTDGRKRDGEL